MKIKNISWDATADSSRGHNYWVHKAMAVTKSKHMSVVTISRTSERASWLSNQLSNLAWSKHFSRFTENLINHEISTLTNEIDDEDVVHVYEGGFFELAVISELSKIKHKSKFIFNLHQSEKWKRLLEASATDVRHNLIAVIRNRGNIILTAESPALADLASEYFQANVYPYPVFSTLPFQLGTQDMGFSGGKKQSKNVTLVLGDFELREDFTRYGENLNSHGYNVTMVIPTRVGALSRFESGLLAKLEALRVKSGQLDPIEYSEMYAKSVAVVLFYSRQQLMYHSSGRIQDCLVFETLPVGYKTSSMANREFVINSLDPNELDNLINAKFEIPKPNSVEDVVRLQIFAKDPDETFETNLPGVEWFSRTSRIISRELTEKRGLKDMLINAGMPLRVGTYLNLVLEKIYATLRSALRARN